MMTEKYILYGTGYIGNYAFKYLRNDDIIGFCDSEKSGSFLGLPIFRLEELKKVVNDTGAIVIVCTINLKYVSQMVTELVKRDISFALFEEVASKYIEKEATEYTIMNPPYNFQYDPKNNIFCPFDKYADAGTIGSYFWMDLWGAKHIFENPVDCHYDIGSRVDGFIAHLLSFGQKVRLIDIRPLELSINGLDFVQADATNLHDIEDESIDSLSALCSLEHFGLGRFGDSIDPLACFKAFDAISRKVRKGGNIYISVPVGEDRLEFHAHRRFSPETIVKSFEQFDLVEYSMITPTGIIKNAVLNENKGTGLFMFRKH